MIEVRQTSVPGDKDRHLSAGKGYAAEDFASCLGRVIWTVRIISSGLSLFVERYQTEVLLILPRVFLMNHRRFLCLIHSILWLIS